MGNDQIPPRTEHSAPSRNLRHTRDGSSANGPAGVNATTIIRPFDRTNLS